LPVEGTVQPPDVNVFSAFAAKPLMWVSFRMSTGILEAGADGAVGAARAVDDAGALAVDDAAGAAVLHHDDREIEISREAVQQRRQSGQTAPRSSDNHHRVRHYLTFRKIFSGGAICW